MNHRYTKPVHHRYFSLVEILVVIAIIGLVGGIIVPNLLGNLEKAKVKAAKQDCKMLAGVVDTFYLDNNAYPRSLEDLVKNPGLPGWKTAYIRDGILPLDPWDNDYQIEVPGGDGRNYDIYSLGADGSSGGEGLNADIYHWHQ